MTPEVASAGIAIATGLVVALLVEAVVAIRMRIGRRASVTRIRDFLLEFEGRVTTAEGTDDGSFPREQVQFALWGEHLDLARLTISAHSPNLKQEHFLELMQVVDGWGRITRMVTDNQRILGSDIYKNYFAALRKLDWLKLGSTPLSEAENE